MRRKIFVIAVLLVAGLAACAAPGPTPTPTPSPRPTRGAALASPVAPTALPPTATPAPTAAPRTLEVALTTRIRTWDPFAAAGDEAAYLANVYETLVRLNPPGVTPRFAPLLTDRWEHNADGTVWTFHLRAGVRFHDGEPLTAEAVKASLETAASRGSDAFLWEPVARIEAVDAATVRFTLKRPAPLLFVLAAPYDAWIVSPKALAAVAKDADYFETGRDGGTGPYRLTAYVPGQEVVLSRFEDYWGGWQAGQFATVRVRLAPDAAAAARWLEDGTVALTGPLPPDLAHQLASRAGFRLQVVHTAWNYLAFFNTLRPPLDDPQVRQALAYAVPYADVIRRVGGLGVQSRGPVPQGMWPWSEEVAQYHEDLAQARALLESAGVTPGGLSLTLTYAQEDPAQAEIAAAIEAGWARLGVQVRPRPMRWRDQWAFARTDPESPETQDVFLLRYEPAYGDGIADNLWTLFHSSGQPFLDLSYWHDADFDALLEKAWRESATDFAAAQADALKAENALVAASPAVFLYDEEAAFVLPDDLRGFRYNLNAPRVPFFFYDLRLGP